MYIYTYIYICAYIYRLLTSRSFVAVQFLRCFGCSLGYAGPSLSGPADVIGMKKGMHRFKRTL